MTDDDRTISRAELERLTAPSPAVATLVVNGSVVHTVTRRTVIGRGPQAEPSTDVVAFGTDRLMSKSHLALEVQASGLIAMDLGSSNGTTVHIGGSSSPLPSDRWTPILDGAVLEVGDTELAVALVTTMATAGAVDSPPTIPNIITAIPSGHGENSNGPPVVAAAAPTFEPPVPAGGASCTACGRALDPGTRFCDGCGSPTAASISPPTVATAWLPSHESTSTDGWPGGPTIGSIPPGHQAGAPSDPPPDGSSRRRWPFIVAAVAGVAALGAVAFTVFGGGDDDGGGGSSAGTPAIPAQAEEQWSVDVDGAYDAVSDGSSVFVTSLDDGDAALTALAWGSGEERWTADLGRRQTGAYVSGVARGVVVVDVCDSSGDNQECTLHGVDAGDGELLWDTDNGTGHAFTEGDLLYRRDGGTLELLDARTGERVERVRGDSVTTDQPYVLVRDDDDVEVFAASDLRSVFGPVEIDDQATAWTYDGSRLLVAVDDEIAVVSKDGTADYESRISADAAYGLTMGPNGSVIVSTDDGILAVRLEKGRAEKQWSADGEYYGTVAADGRRMAMLIDDGDLAYLDLATGDTVLEVRDYYDRDVSTGRNGALIIEYAGDDYEVTAVRFDDGDEMWQEDFDEYPILLDGALLTVQDDEVALYR